MAFTRIRTLISTIALVVLANATLFPLSAQAAKNPPSSQTDAHSTAGKTQKKPTNKNKSTPLILTKPSLSKKSKTISDREKSSSRLSAAPSVKKSVTKRAAPPAKRARRKTRQSDPASYLAAAALPAASVQAEARALRSSTAYVQDLESSQVLFAKNENVVRPIASISKLMTAVVVVDANLPMDEMLEITDEDVDYLKHTSSRLAVGTRLTRADMLHLALMSSENRAAHALGRNYPGGLPAFVAAMNAKARALGMTHTHFIEPTGLSSSNVSSPRDLARLLRAAGQRPLIHRYSTDTEHEVEVQNRSQVFHNTNLLVRKPDWDIKISKTGFINELNRHKIKY